MVYFNDALNTFMALQLYGIGIMVKDQLDTEKGKPPPLHGLLSSNSSK